MDWFFYAVALPMAGLFLASTVYALYWASKNGQLRDFDRGAESIFDHAEPIGQPTDFFPGKAPVANNPAASKS
jgi:cbb3-type cytochrome oxidase maturation protein